MQIFSTLTFLAVVLAELGYKPAGGLSQEGDGVTACPDQPRPAV
jgi:hypothetical protein